MIYPKLMFRVYVEEYSHECGHSYSEWATLEEAQAQAEKSNADEEAQEVTLCVVLDSWGQ